MSDRNLETDGYFLLVSGNYASCVGGNTEADGTRAEFTADNQSIEGDFAVDTASTRCHGREHRSMKQFIGCSF